MKGIAGSLATAVGIVMILFVLVRPGSKGPALVTNVATGIKNIIGAATGGGSFNPK